MEGLDLKQLVDGGIAMVLVLMIVVPVFRHLVKQTEANNTTLMELVKEENAAHKTEIELILAAHKIAMESIASSVSKLTDRVELLHEDVSTLKREAR